MRNKAKLLLYTLLVCSLSFLFFSCNNPSQPGGSTTTSVVKNINADTAMNLQKAEAILYEANMIVGPAVGAAGTRTTLYDSYEWLQKNVPDSVLIRLTGYSNPYTRTYAFMALCKRKSLSVRSHFDRNKYDTSSLYMMNGCLGSSCQLNYVWLGKMYPLLDSSEYVSIAKKIIKDYPMVPICMLLD
jgi:hypothetical protein